VRFQGIDSLLQCLDLKASISQRHADLLLHLQLNLPEAVHVASLNLLIGCSCCLHISSESLVLLLQLREAPAALFLCLTRHLQAPQSLLQTLNAPVLHLLLLTEAPHDARKLSRAALKTELLLLDSAKSGLQAARREFSQPVCFLAVSYLLPVQGGDRRG